MRQRMKNRRVKEGVQMEGNWETVFGLNLNHHNICLFTKTAVNLVALCLEDLELVETGEWPLPCFLLGTHSAYHDFCGREDILEQIAVKLLPSKSTVTALGTVLRQYTLCGFGGIGETEIAREFARRQKSSFDADSSGGKSKVVSREIVKGWLSNSRRDLSDSDHLAQPGHDSMFTRNPSGLDPCPLTIDESLSLFNYYTSGGEKPENETAQQISEALGGIPLAIAQMAGIIYRQDLALYRTLYETRFDTNIVLYRHSLSTVWAIDKLKPQARELLELVAFLGPDVIGEDLLMKLSVDPHSKGLTFRKSCYPDARADLLQSTLLQRNKQKAAVPHVGRWPVCAALYPHVLILMHHLWPAILEPSDATSLNFARLLTEAAWYQKERVQTKEFDGFFDTAHSICETSQHPDRDSLLADIYFCLGAIAMDASNFNSSLIFKEYSPRSGEPNLSWALLARGKLDESVKTGLLLYVLGNLRAAQSEWDESYEYHQRALSHMRATVGERDFLHCQRISQDGGAHVSLGTERGCNGKSMTNKAPDIWAIDPSAHKNEIARTTFFKGQIFAAMGKTAKASIAFRVASRLRKEITKEDHDAKSLSMVDFDSIVAFWAR
ncbi:hypothetical protein M433DRAFT_146445 [Acidomyces richmondensis BFW]|nr:hypothetical protein M433DRAFT_146445 [Acidomyces richmondensis BFW]